MKETRPLQKIDKNHISEHEIVIESDVNVPLLALIETDPVRAVGEILIGALKQTPGEWVQISASILSAARRNKIKEQLLCEIYRLQEQGKIREGFETQQNGFDSFVELLEFIDTETCDLKRIHAVFAMFVAINSLANDDLGRVAQYRLFQIAKLLSASELMTLATLNAIRKDGLFAEDDGFLGWTHIFNEMCNRMGQSVIRGLINQDIQKLKSLGLLDIGGSISKVNIGMTDIAVAFCNNIEEIELPTK